MSVTSLVSLVATTWLCGAAPLEHVRLVAPKPDNMQFMSFWVAQASGYFRQEGVEVDVSIPIAPQATTQMVLETNTDAAILPPPMYLELIDRETPFVVVANLFSNDPIDLIVKRSEFEKRRLRKEAPLAERLRGLRGLKIGVAPHPPVRLRALFSAVGLDVEKELELVTLHGREQNAAFADGTVNALYAHTPYLEKALLEQDGVVVVDQAGGEVKGLASRQIHTLVVARSFLEGHRDVVVRMVRAIAKAQQLIHRDPERAAKALARYFPDRDANQLRAVVRLYKAAVPKTPAVSIDGFKAALAFFPEGKPVPDFTGRDLSPYLEDIFSERKR